jgi:Zn-dependent protease with chaperone function
MAFVIALVASLGVRLWLASRQVAHVRAHRDATPAAFADRIDAASHRKAADYTVAKQRQGMLETVVDALVLVAITLGGGLAALFAITESLSAPPLLRDLALLIGIAIISGVVSLPFSWWRTFRIEERFGFNRMTQAAWFSDLAKGVAIGAVLGLPLALLVLWLMRAAGTWWWLYAWLAWMGFQLLLLVLYPTVIAPIFNRFSPLPAGDARERIEALLTRCGFRASGLFVMDGSKRSGHGNAYFTGFGRAKRVVFFDTLLARLMPEEIEAVLAHEASAAATRVVIMALGGRRQRLQSRDANRRRRMRVVERRMQGIGRERCCIVLIELDQRGDQRRRRCVPGGELVSLELVPARIRGRQGRQCEREHRQREHEKRERDARTRHRGTDVLFRNPESHVEPRCLREPREQSEQCKRQERRPDDALDHVAPTKMTKLVRKHRFDLFGLKAREQRVEEHDALRATESREVRVAMA